MFPDLYLNASCGTSSSTINLNLGNDSSIVAGQDCIGTTFPSVGKMSQILLSMNGVPSSGLGARFSTISGHARACWSPIHTYRDIGPFTGTNPLVAVFNVGALTGLTYESQFGGRNMLFPKLQPAPMSCKLDTVRCIAALTPNGMKTRNIGFYNNGASFLAKGYSSYPSSAVPVVKPTVAFFCLTETDWLSKGDDLIAHRRVCTPSSGG